jgi:hypothetical protein
MASSHEVLNPLLHIPPSFPSPGTSTRKNKDYIQSDLKLHSENGLHRDPRFVAGLGCGFGVANSHFDLPQPGYDLFGLVPSPVQCNLHHP